jgi:hypothetical protein
MDISEKLAFLWVTVMGMVLVGSAITELPYESYLIGGIGFMLLLFVTWAFLSEVSKRYKIVRT